VLTLAQHSLGGDAVLPECLYDVLTHPRYGVGLSPEVIDKASFEAAGATIIAEDFGASPVVRNESTLRNVVGQMLTYMRGVLYYDGGKIRLKLLREEVGESVTDITVDDLEEPPEPVPGEWASTWGQTRVTCLDKENAWEKTVIAYNDPANIRVRGTVVAQTIEREWITRTSVAKAEAARLGTLHGLPLATCSMRLRPAFRTLRPGQLLRLTYPKLNLAETFFRAEKVRAGGPADPAVHVDAIEDPARQTTLSYVPASIDAGQPGRVIEALAPATVRLAVLPDDLKAGSLDGMLVAISRPTGITVRNEVHFTWDPSSASYALLASSSRFPVYGACQWWRRGTDGAWVVRFKVAGSYESGRIAAMAGTFDDLYLFTGRRLEGPPLPGDFHQMEPAILRRKIGGRF
ncbi:MAG: phage tail protein, partial [Burkholderiales bacterium]